MTQVYFTDKFLNELTNSNLSDPKQQVVLKHIDYLQLIKDLPSCPYTFYKTFNYNEKKIPLKKRDLNDNHIPVNCVTIDSIMDFAVFMRENESQWNTLNTSAEIRSKSKHRRSLNSSVTLPGSLATACFLMCTGFNSLGSGIYRLTGSFAAWMSLAAVGWLFFFIGLGLLTWTITSCVRICIDPSDKAERLFNKLNTEELELIAEQIQKTKSVYNIQEYTELSKSTEETLYITKPEECSNLMASKHKILYLVKLDATSIKDIFKTVPATANIVVAHGLNKDAFNQLIEDLQTKEHQIDTLVLSEMDETTLTAFDPLTEDKIILSLESDLKSNAQRQDPIQFLACGNLSPKATNQLSYIINKCNFPHKKDIILLPSCSKESALSFLTNLDEEITPSKIRRIDLSNYPDPSILFHLKSRIFEKVVNQIQIAQLIKFMLEGTTSDKFILEATEEFLEKNYFNIHALNTKASSYIKRAKLNDGEFELVWKSTINIINGKELDSLIALVSYKEKLSGSALNLVDNIIRIILNKILDKAIKSNNIQTIQEIDAQFKNFLIAVSQFNTSPNILNLMFIVASCITTTYPSLSTSLTFLNEFFVNELDKSIKGTNLSIDQINKLKTWIEKLKPVHSNIKEIESRPTEVVINIGTHSNGFFNNTQENQEPSLNVRQKI